MKFLISKRPHVLSTSILVASMGMASACSSLSPQAKESLTDIRGSLPKFLRGDAVPLEEQPMPSLGGEWVDENFPQLKLKVKQSGDKLLINRDGERYGIPVVEEINGLLKGRAIEARFINNSPNQIRPTSGKCIGSATKNEQNIRLTCTYKGDTFPLNFTKKG